MSASSLKSQRILGLDPGYAITGYGCLDWIGNQALTIEWGVIRTRPDIGHEKRLFELKQELVRLISRLKPTESAVEEVFFAKNVKTALKVAEARGVIMATLAEKRLPITNYTPLQIKQALTGYGQASKLQVQSLLVQVLEIEKMPRPDDAADAMAIAYTHAVMTGKKLLQPEQ